MTARRLLAVLGLVAALVLTPTSAAMNGKPVNTSAPTITGQAIEGGILTSSTGTWSGSPTSYAYAWKRCSSSGTHCTTIGGAVDAAYTASYADVGHALRAVVTASNRYGSRAASSAPTAPIAAAAGTAPASSSSPVVSGTAAVGAVLTTTTGSWSGSTPMTYAYQWQSCDASGANCAAIQGATNVNYSITSDQEGRTIRSSVTASNAYGSASAPSDPTAVVQAAPPSSGLHVSGNQLVDGSGTVVHLHGVNYSGPEYACIQGWGIFDGPSDAGSVAAIASWRSNIVRIPLNEDCWLGINGVPTAYGGPNYRNAIVNYVNLLHASGLYAELSLMWGAPGANKATYQPAAPDADHSPAMWSSLAATFKDDPNVILAPWGETTVSASCFLNGGDCGATWGGTPYTSAGMQEAVDVMRQAGYTGPISIPGIKYANDLSQWLSYEPADPLNQLVAEAHIYGKNTCDTTTCFDTTIAPVAAQVPVFFGETGETYDASDCGSSYISTFMNWADANGVGYAAWTWNTWGNCSSLIASFDGTPANAYGTWVKNHYATLP